MKTGLKIFKIGIIIFAIFHCNNAIRAISCLAPESFRSNDEASREIRRKLLILTSEKSDRDSTNQSDTVLTNASKNFLGIRSTGIFAPMAYWRSETDWGIGDFDTLLKLVYFAKKTNQSTVQLLPLNIPLFDNSPYAIASTYVFDPVYIGIEGLLQLLGADEDSGGHKYSEAMSLILSAQDEIKAFRKEPKSTNQKTRELKYRVLKVIFEEFKRNELGDDGDTITNYIIGKENDINTGSGSKLTRNFKLYCRENSSWLGDHLLFFMLAKEFGTDDFRKWPRDVALRKPKVIQQYKEKYKEAILFEAFLQWVIKEQLDLVNLYAGEGEEKVEIMLDQPFAFGSADVWTNMDAFIINKRTLKRDYTQVAPPHRIDVPQYWQFYLLNFDDPKAKQLLLDRFNYILRFCSILRIDHLLGYYRLYYLSEDTTWSMTLQSMGIWGKIQEIFDSQLDVKEKRKQIYETIIAGIKQHLPKAIQQQLFDESGALRSANIILASRKSFIPGEYDRAQCGWHKQYSAEHEQDLLYTLLNPNKYGPDYLKKIIQDRGMFLQSTDSIRVGFFGLGLGEEIVSAFMDTAQRQGKEVVFENLGVVPKQIEDSLRQLGSCQFKPLFFGYQFFKGDHNQYWFDRITKRDYACFGIHDNVPIKGWWEGREHLANEKYYLKTTEQKQAVVKWLKDNGYLSPDAQVDLQSLTPDLQRAVLLSVADSSAGLVVFMMPDIFGSGDEGVINIPGKIGFWTARAPVTIEDLICAADNKLGVSQIAVDTISLMRDLSQVRQRDSFSKQVQGLDSQEPHLINVNPAVGSGYKQIAYKGSYFVVDAVVYGRCDKAEVVLDNGCRYEMQELNVASNLPDNLKLYRVHIKVDNNLVKTNPFQIVLNGAVKSDWGYLIGLQENTDANPLSDIYGQVRQSVVKMPEDEVDKDVLNDIFGQLKDWVKEQRWFMEKTSDITGINVVDYFELTEDTDEIRSFGIVCDVTTRSQDKEETQTYFIPLTIFSGKSQADDSCMPINVRGREIYVMSAEHTLVYQRGLVKRISSNENIRTNDGNTVSFISNLEHGKTLSAEVASSENLLKGTGVTTSNILTEVSLVSAQKLVVKTIKKGAEDTEAEMYIALQGYKHIPQLFGAVFMDIAGRGHIPLCIAIEKLEVPSGLKSWESKSGYNIWNAFSTALNTFVAALQTGSYEVSSDQILSDILSRPVFNSGLNNQRLIEHLAEVIGGFHIFLAKNSGEGFGIQRASAQDIERLHGRYIAQELEQVVAHLGGLTGEAPKLVGEFFGDQKDEIESLLKAVINSVPDITLSRIHGDMQLDQILFNQMYNLVVLDLGGAPLEKIENRRLKTLTVHDIAGIIRAFGYIKYAALKGALAVDNLTLYKLLKGDYSALALKEFKLTPQQVEQTISFANKIESEFKRILVDTYMRYLEEQRATDIIMAAWDRDAVERLVDFCVIARALYEIDYELSSRPDENGALIPLDGLQGGLEKLKAFKTEYDGIIRKREIKQGEKVIDSYIEQYEQIKRGLEARDQEQKKIFIDIETLSENQRYVLEGEEWTKRKKYLEKIFPGCVFEVFEGSVGLSFLNMDKKNTIILVSKRYEHEERYASPNAKFIFIQNAGDEYYFPIDSVICLGIGLLNLDEQLDKDGSLLVATIYRIYKEITQQNLNIDDIRSFMQVQRLSIILPPIMKYFDELNMYAIDKLEQYA